MRINEWIKDKKKIDWSKYPNVPYKFRKDIEDLIMISEIQSEALERAKITIEYNHNLYCYCSLEGKCINGVAEERITTAQTEVERIINGKEKK